MIAGGTSPARRVVECLDLVKMKWTEFPNLNRCHWWTQIGTLSSESPQVLFVAGLNEKYLLQNVEYLDFRENAKKWRLQPIASNGDQSRIHSLLWLR